MKEKPQAIVVAKRWLAADRYLLFRAFSRSKLMAQWMFTAESGSAEVTNEFKMGGKFSISTGQGEEVTLHTGAYKEILPGRKITFTWNSDAVQNTEVTITFAEKEGGSEVVLTHSLLPNEEMREEFERFWNACLDNLEKMTTERK